MLELKLTPKDDLADILNSLDCPATIYLAAGVYRQKTEIRRGGLRIVGESRETTIITYGDYARKIHADGKEYNTFRTYTMCVAADNVTLENLTVENSTADPAEAGQCVALSVNGRDFYAKNVCIKSTQDTLFLAPFPDDLVVRYRGFIPENQLYMEGGARCVFEKCQICGTVDFIFGCAEAYFAGCEIVSLFDRRGHGYVAAPAHSLKQERGFVFYGCDFKDGGAGKNTVYLARPWRDFGKCEFIDCRLDGHIKPELYDKWNDTQRDKTARFAHCGLTAPSPLSPVGWSGEIPRAMANEIINTLTAWIKAKK